MDWSTFIQFHPLSFTFIDLHWLSPISSTFIQFHPFSPTFITFYLLLFTLNHFHPPLFTFVHFHLQSSTFFYFVNWMKSFTLKLLMFPTRRPNHNCYYFKVQSVSFWFHKISFWSSKNVIPNAKNGRRWGRWRLRLWFDIFANLTFLSNLTFP